MNFFGITANSLIRTVEHYHHFILYFFHRFTTQRCLSVQNEPVLEFKSGSSERAAVEKALKEIQCKTEDVPIVIGNEEVWTKDVKYQVCVSKFCKFFW